VLLLRGCSPQLQLYVGRQLKQWPTALGAEFQVVAAIERDLLDEALGLIQSGKLKMLLLGSVLSLGFGIALLMLTVLL
jgi:hypothetical protein